jgi:tetratricopeptide (TPR) repeat protein
LIYDAGRGTKPMVSVALQTPRPEREPERRDGDADTSADGDLVVDGWTVLDGLRRRLDEQTNQSRKTQQQVTQLTESIAALVEGQRRRTRRINLNSFVAYVIFTILCGAAFYALYARRAGELVDAGDRAKVDAAAATRRADEAVASVAARQAADARAWEIYQLIEQGKRAEATEKLAASGGVALSRTERAILAARVHEPRVPDVDAVLKAATASFRAGRYPEVIAPLEAALVGEPAGARAASMRYFLGIAYSKTGPLDKAVTYLQAAVDAGVAHVDARFQLASVLDRNGASAAARAEYDKFVAAYPQSQFAAYARGRSAALAAALAPPRVVPIAAPATPAPVPAPADPAPADPAP